MFLSDGQSVGVMSSFGNGVDCARGCVWCVCVFVGCDVYVCLGDVRLG